MNQTIVDAVLKVDEGTGPMTGGRFVVYDDATGKPIIPGTLVKGHPTIGYGCALDTRGISQAEALALMHDGQSEFWQAMQTRWPWMIGLDDVRQAALMSMCYNLGVAGLAGFPKFLAAVQNKQWQVAVAELKNSRWWSQVGNRAIRISDMILTGQLGAAYANP